MIFLHVHLFKREINGTRWTNSRYYSVENGIIRGSKRIKAGKTATTGGVTSCLDDYHRINWGSKQVGVTNQLHLNIIGH
jgi:hypothetical protein